jgi:RsmE family RNA methyltransferase
VLTDSVQRSWGGIHEYERLERLIIASAEQAKQFAVPQLHEPISLETAIAQQPLLIYGDPAGNAFKTVFQALPPKKNELKQCAVLVGPEADFTLHEKRLLQNHGAIGCALTPTVLRSHLAITMLAGAVRSWYHTKE